MDRRATAGAQWTLKPPAHPVALLEMGLPKVVAQLLHNRGITTPAKLESFLSPTLQDPAELPDMELACARLHRALQSGETIGIFGDFDVDGVTGTALVTEALRDLGVRAIPYIPDRVEEGHGLNEAAVQDLKSRGVSVLVTVDCGVTSTREIAFAQEVGVDVIVTDHHVVPPSPPPALCVIDPKREDSDYPFLDLSGAGLAFKLIEGLYSLAGRSWKRDLLELAALSTIADLVPLRGENRYLVREGLKELNSTRRPGLQALYRRARISEGSVDAETVSFCIAPRLNAAGRLDHAAISLQLLLTQDPEEADVLAVRLDELNRERQRLTTEGRERAREMVHSLEDIPPIIVVEDESLNPGIAGLVASSLVEEFYRPAIVLCSVDGVLRASARSIPEFDLVADALTPCIELFQRHGGHQMAAGFQMAPEHLPKLREKIGRIGEAVLGDLDLLPTLQVEAEVAVGSLLGETFQWIKDLEPYGVDNPKPTFLSRNMRPLDVRHMGAQGQHLRLKLKEAGVVWDAVAFRQGPRWTPGTEQLDAVYSIGTDRWRGEEVLSLKLLAFRPSAG